jgi:hypothetical protein
MIMNNFKVTRFFNWFCSETFQTNDFKKATQETIKTNGKLELCVNSFFRTLYK